MRLLNEVFDSDSEYERLLLIQTSLSYKLNPTILGTFTQDGVVAEVIGVTGRLSSVGKMGRLDDLLLGVVDETLREVFREEGAKVIYDFLENNCHLKREEIAEKPEVFSAGLERLLGSGALVVEKLILKNLYSRLRLEHAGKKVASS